MNFEKNIERLGFKLKDIFLSLQSKIGTNYSCLYVDDEHNNLRLALSSNSQWQKVFVQEDLIQHCPLIAIRQKLVESGRNGNFLLRWDQVKPVTRSQHLVYSLREDFNIGQGFSIGTTKLGFKIMTAICPEVSDMEFYPRLFNEFEVLAEYHKSIECAVIEASSYMKQDETNIINFDGDQVIASKKMLEV